MSLDQEKIKRKRLNIKIKNRGELFSLYVDGFRITDFYDLENHYEFKGEWGYNSVNDTYLFKLDKVSETDEGKHKFKLSVLDSTGWYTGFYLSLTEIKVRRLFLKKCIELIEFYEYNKT